MTLSDVYVFMAKCKLGVLGTIGPDNRPQSSLVGIALNADLEVIFDTVRSSRKYANLVARPCCSFSVGWAGEETVQYEGDAQELTGSQLEPYREGYFAVWPECRAHLSWPDITYFVVRPRWLRYSDFDKTPPSVEEFRWRMTQTV